MATQSMVLSQYRGPLEDMLQRVLDEFEAQLPPLSRHGKWSLDTLREYTLRPSKRVRGSLAAGMYDHVTGKSLSESGLRLGAAIEIMQNHLLIIDDVMDRSVLRRGLPTVHIEYEDDYHVDNEHEAGMVGVQVGLVAGHCANIALLGCDEDPKQTLETLRTLHRHIATTDMGQMDDLQQQVRHMPISYDDLLRRYQQKSSYYSFVDPLETALILAGKDPEESKKAAEAYGLPAGVAFQLQDDYLGIFGDPDETGKPNLDDLREGKYTFLVHYAFEKLAEKEAGELRNILGSREAGEAELKAVQRMLEKSGAVAQSQKMAEDFAAQATKAAHVSSLWNEEFARILEDMVTFAVERTK